MGNKGEYICIVGTLTTPLHNLWCDAAIAYQKKNLPDMKLVTDRFPGADEIDTTEQVVRNALQAYPDLRGVIGIRLERPDRRRQRGAAAPAAEQARRSRASRCPRRRSR